MLQKFASAAFCVGALTALLPAAALAQNHGRNSGGGRSAPSGGRTARSGSYAGERFSGGNRNYAPPARTFVTPRGNEERRGYSAAPGYYRPGYFGARSYDRPVYRGYYGGGLYLDYAAPYSNYDPGYVYDSPYAGSPDYSYEPAPARQACTAGSYDRYGAWIPAPDCYSEPQQYQPQPNYGPGPQAPQPPQNYAPDPQPYQQQRYQQPPPTYDSSQSQGYNR